MTIEQARALVAESPALHRSVDGRAQVGGMSRTIGNRFIDEIDALDRPRISETGSGLSTLLFCALDPSSVISISPAPDLHDRTLAEAEQRGIDTSMLRFIDDRSESALPLLALVEGVEIDVGFIDGNHGWPAVFVDFCYLGKMLQPGGLMFVDDIHVYAVAELVGLLRMQTPHYEFVSVDGKMATFRKVLDLDWLPDWSMEPFITMNTASYTPDDPMARFWKKHEV